MSGPQVPVLCRALAIDGAPAPGTVLKSWVCDSSEGEQLSLCGVGGDIKPGYHTLFSFPALRALHGRPSSESMRFTDLLSPSPPVTGHQLISACRIEDAWLG